MPAFACLISYWNARSIPNRKRLWNLNRCGGSVASASLRKMAAGRNDGTTTTGRYLSEKSSDVASERNPHPGPLPSWGKGEGEDLRCGSALRKPRSIRAAAFFSLHPMEKGAGFAHGWPLALTRIDPLVLMRDVWCCESPPHVSCYDFEIFLNQPTMNAGGGDLPFGSLSLQSSQILKLGGNLGQA